MSLLRFIITDHVQLFALTATATKDTFQVVCSQLSLVNPVVIAVSPNVKCSQTIEDFCKQISQDIKLKRMEYPFSATTTRMFQTFMLD